MQACNRGLQRFRRQRPRPLPRHVVVGTLLFEDGSRAGREGRRLAERELLAECSQCGPDHERHRHLIGINRQLRLLAQRIPRLVERTVHGQRIEALYAGRVEAPQRRCVVLRGDLDDRQHTHALAFRVDRHEAQRPDADAPRMDQPVAVRGALERMLRQRLVDPVLDLAAHFFPPSLRRRR